MARLLPDPPAAPIRHDEAVNREQTTSPRPAGRILRGAGIGAAAAGTAAAMFALLATPFVGPEPAGVALHSEFALPDAVLALLHLPVAALLLARSRHPAGWALLVVGTGFAVSATAIQVTLLTPGGVSQHRLPPFVVTGWLTAALTTILVLPWLLAAHSPDRTGRVGAAAGGLLVLGASAARLVTPIPGVQPFLTARVAPVGTVLSIVCVAYAAVTVAAFVRRRGRGGRAERRIRLWLGVAAGLVAVGYASFEAGLDAGGPWPSLAATFLFSAHVMLLAVVIVLLSAHPLGRAEVVASRAIAGALLTAAVVGCYLALVWIGSAWLPGGTDGGALLAVAALALAVTPLRSLIQRRVDDLVVGPGSRADRLLDRLRRELAAGPAEPGTPVLHGLLAGIASALRLGTITVDDAAGRPLATIGTPADAPAGVVHELPLHRADVVIGTLRFSGRRGERLDGRTLDMLDRISGFVAVALELAVANAQLDALRRRLVDVRQEERRLMRRELHDGLGPALSGAALAVAAVDASRLSETDRDLLTAVRRELTQRCDDVRDLARYALPPPLDDGRLGVALRRLAERHDGDLRVEVRAVGVDAVDSRRQAVLYHVAAEALRNVVRHAGAAHCVVDARTTASGTTLLTVTDDGRGIADDVEPGVGLRSMHERAEESGGTLVVRRGEPSGTVVELVLP